MRVTDKMGYTQVTNHLQKNRADMVDFQNQAATQKRVNKPSDDPVAAARVLGAKTDERAQNQFVKNTNVARSFLEFTDQSLSECSETLMRLKELAIQQASDAGASQETRSVAAEEVEQMFAQLVQIGNRKLGERYIFGGYKTTQAPFDIEGNYHGDNGDIKVHVNKDAFIAMNLPGVRVFLGEGVSADGIMRDKSSVPKNAEDLLQHQQKLQIEEPKEVQLRAPAALRGEDRVYKSQTNESGKGVNILQAVKDFSIGLRVNDKAEIQEAIDNIDLAISQIVHARAQVGARQQVLNLGVDSLQKAIVDNRATASVLEDADLFQLVSDMSKTDSALKATLETSGKIIQPSLLDFLK